MTNDVQRAMQVHCAVLGKPISHSLSPILHQAAYQSLKLENWQYSGIEMSQEDFPTFLTSLDNSWAGLSLTMPLKRTIQPFGESSNLWARELQVANTVVFDRTVQPPRLKLFNTDVYGIVRAFEEAAQQYGTPEPATYHSAIILGNGNTATSALAACAMMGNISHVTIAARHPDRNPELITLGERHGIDVSLIALDNVISALHSPVDMVVNTIPALGADEVAEELLQISAHVHGTLLDVVYDPRPTALMKAWRACGGTAIGGEQMLLYQAVAQVLLMTGHAQDDDFDYCGTKPLDIQLETAMRAALEEAL